MRASSEHDAVCHGSGAMTGGGILIWCLWIGNKDREGNGGVPAIRVCALRLLQLKNLLPLLGGESHTPDC